MRQTIQTKKIALVAVIFFFFIGITRAQNVGIGTRNPNYKLSVQTAQAAGNWGFMHSDSVVEVGDYISSAGVAEFGTRTAHSLWLIAGNHDNPFPAMTIDAAGTNVGFGTLAPANHLQLGSTPGFSGNDIAIGNGTQAMSFFQSPAISNWYSNTAFALMGVNGGSGLVGINTQSPSNKLQIGSVGSSGYAGNDIAFGNGAQVSALAQTAAAAQWYTNNTSIVLMPGGNGDGFVGINAQTPANKLQIGSVGSSGYSNNDIAFGNGAQVSAIAQTPNAAQWYTNNTNIALMPMGNGHGRVGINTTRPLAPLDVEDYVQMNGNENTPTVSEQGPGYAYLQPGSREFQVGWFANTDFCQSCVANVSIYAAGNVMAYELDAISDARVKEVHGKTNGAEDLGTINQLEITNYQMKDRVKYGDKPFKKVIAQQVEKVYPQVVNKSVNYIPNVYQLCSSVEKNSRGWLLSFNEPHQLTRDAKKLQLIDGKGIQQRYDIIAIPSDKQVLLNAPGLSGDTLFVYGEEVNDFRSVDYEGLTTLNISATQELSKQVIAQQATIKEQNEKLIALVTKLDALMAGVKILQHK